MPDIEESVVKLSVNATGWNEYFQEKLTDFDTTRERLALALSMCRDEILIIVQEELERAAGQTVEFSNPLLLKPMKEAFGREGIVKVNYSSGTVYLDPDLVAGSVSDLWDGIEYARAALGVSQKSSIEDRARYWRNYVYRTAGVYEETVTLRLEGWNGLTPYWFWLEYGNKEYPYAFPKSSAHPFVKKAEERAKALFKTTLMEVELQEENLVDNSLSEFAKNPDGYEPFDVLDEFYSQGRRYLVYVTSTKQLGVALPKTYRGLQQR